MNQRLARFRRILSITLGRLQSALGVTSTTPFILCYHGIGQGGYLHDISKREFAKQINYLSKHYTFVTLDDITKYVSGQKSLKQAVAITFDDGYASILQVADLLDKYNIKPTVFVMSDPKAVNHHELANTHPLLSPYEVKRHLAKGWSLGCHSATHPNLNNVSPEGLAHEIKNAKTALEKLYQVKVQYFAYPKGQYNQAVVRVVKQAGYKAAFSMDDQTLIPGIDPYTIGRIGINATHSLSEFGYLATPWVSTLRAVGKGVGYAA